MKDFVFIADDNRIAASLLAEMRLVAARFGFEDPLDYSHIEARRGELLSRADSLAQEGNQVFLITDASFPFEPIPQFGGARLCEDFLKVGSSDTRAIVCSSQPLLTDELKRNPRVLAAQRSDAISDLFIFLKYGKTPSVKRCLDFLRHIDAIHHLVSNLQGYSAESIPMIIETLGQGFGSVVPEPFDGSTLDLFDTVVNSVLGKGIYRDLWTEVVRSLHPYDALKSAASREFSPGTMPGSFLILWFACLARSKPLAALTSLRKCEECFAPREQEWIRRRRIAVAQKIQAQYAESTETEKWRQLLAGARQEIELLHKLLKTRDEVGG